MRTGVYIIGIAGGSGSGKTTFAKKIIRNLDHTHPIPLHGPKPIRILHLDNYYLSPQPEENWIDGKPNFDTPDAFDWDLFYEHVQTLKNNGSVKIPVYDFKLSTRIQETKPLGPVTILMIEGIYAFWDPRVIPLMDLKIFLHVKDDIRLIRRLARDAEERNRDVDSIINQYYQTVRPMHLKYVAPTAECADLLVPEETDMAATIIAAKLKEILNNQ